MVNTLKLAQYLKQRREEKPLFGLSIFGYSEKDLTDREKVYDKIQLAKSDFLKQQIIIGAINNVQFKTGWFRQKFVDTLQETLEEKNEFRP